MRPVNIAHRGASGMAPENTLSAFQKAAEFGADLIEFDIHQTKDGHLVVMHDAKVSRTTNGKGLIEDFTLEEIRKLDAGSWFSPEFFGEKVPNLEDVLDLAKESRLGVNVELKRGRNLYPGMEEKLVKLIERYDFTQPVIVSSMHTAYLAKIRKLNPYIALSKVLVPVVFLPWDSFPRDCDVIQPHWTMLSTLLVHGAHRQHLKVNTWCVNNPGLLQHCINMGVDGIMTNFPDRLSFMLHQTKG